jgi:membrane protease YdiL (CAAX protease family)
MNPLRSAALCFAVACGFSWAIAAVVALTTPTPLTKTLLFVVFMFGPALGAVVAARLGGPPLLPMMALRPNRSWLLAWLAPFPISAATVVVGMAMPGVVFRPGLDSVLLRMQESGLSATDIAEAQAKLAGMSWGMWVLMLVVQPLVAGISINAIAAFGEELGWRGTLEASTRSLGFWTSAVVVGVLWGLWHAPIILMGHNYPQHPVIGVAMMVVFCVLLAPLHLQVRQRGASVWAAAILHGTVNATAGASLLLLQGGSDLTVGLTGLSGFIVLGAVNLGLWWWRRRPGRSVHPASASSSTAPI